MDLYHLAKVWVRTGRTRPSTVAYRNGPKEYFHDCIMDKQNGILDCRLKDLSGHERNPINNNLSGIFFQCNVDTKGVPNKYSPYGPCRLQMPAYSLLDNCKLYFSDFFCLKEKRPKHKPDHYVIIVAVKPDSNADALCIKANLLQLKSHSNPLLQLDKTTKSVIYNTKVTTEIMYTEDLDLNYWCQVERASFSSCSSNGRKSKKGLLHNHQCEICDHPSEADVDVIARSLSQL